MKVLTLNTHSWLEEQAEDKLQIIAQEIAAGDYDVIALQEVNQSITAQTIIPDGSYCPTQASVDIKEDNFALRLVEALEIMDIEYYWSWSYSHIGYDRYHEGNALLSKQPIVATEYLASKANDVLDHTTRKNLSGLTEVAGKMVQVVSCHFSWWDQGKFAYEWQQTEAFLQEATNNILILGDFNNDESSPGYQLVLDSPLGLQDAFTLSQKTTGAATVNKAIDGWQENAGHLRIDYVFVTGNVAVQEYEVVFDGNRVPIVSDHFGVKAVLTLTEG
ncbi:endonuclease/exonuclease/phosphatase family protein [Enterococcus sp. DIV0876]|uniref:endonuclease/exonuclease/phosphatase family protein n=1 Tax=Enterococcus sp. DIV0876 TaxID=2774633 RepID=UPI003D30028A